MQGQVGRAPVWGRPHSKGAPAAAQPYCLLEHKRNSPRSVSDRCPGDTRRSASIPSGGQGKQHEIPSVDMVLDHTCAHVCIIIHPENSEKCATYVSSYVLKILKNVHMYVGPLGACLYILVYVGPWVHAYTPLYVCVWGACVYTPVYVYA